MTLALLSQLCESRICVYAQSLIGSRQTMEAMYEYMEKVPKDSFFAGHAQAYPEKNSGDS